MKADAWEGGHRMPFLVRWPGTVKPGSVTNQMICFTDFLKTFAAIVDAELPQDAGPDSVDFLPVLLGEQPESKPVREHLVVAAGGMKMIRIYLLFRFIVSEITRLLHPHAVIHVRLRASGEAKSSQQQVDCGRHLSSAGCERFGTGALHPPLATTLRTASKA